MGNLSELQFLPSYHKGENDIASEFYLPCMNKAVSYDRAVGFFSSSIYTISWKSLRKFIERGGKIRIICSPVLNTQDVNSINEGYISKNDEELTEILKNEIRRLINDPILEKPTKVLAALVSIGALDFHIAFIGSQSRGRHIRLFHDKVGIFNDDYGNSVVFKGSMNETWSGLSEDGNLESIDVYVGWGEGRDSIRVEEEIRYFNSLWNNEFPTVKVREFPSIAKDEFINSADVKNWPFLVDEICEEIDRANSLSADGKPDGRIPRPHQILALDKWEKQGRRGIFEHATGSGKTFTALCAMRDSLCRKETILVFVPSEILLFQWYKEIKETFNDLEPALLLCGAGHIKWRGNQLLRSWTEESDKPKIVISTLQTGVSNEFLDLVREGEHIFVIIDEVHRAGSRENQKILDLNFGARLGLSATPRRAGDPDGTEKLVAYFNGIIKPPFTLKDAIAANTLTPYMYYFHSIKLRDHEQTKWDDITGKIGRLYAIKESGGGGSSDLDNRINQLLITRAGVVKQAEDKIPLVKDVLNNNFADGQRWIVYCDSLDQLQKIVELLRSQGLPAGEYHSEMEGDREQTLRNFDVNGGILVSIRCLDEGVDIPSVSHALILASSKNPREFIQRRGRVLRKAPGKILAFIHDAIVIPNQPFTDTPSSKSFLEGELARAIAFGKSAKNPSSIFELERIAIRFGIDYTNLLEEGYEDD